MLENGDRWETVLAENLEADAKLYLLSNCASVTDLNKGEALRNVLSSSGTKAISYTVPSANESNGGSDYHLRQVDKAGNVSGCVSFNYEFDGCQVWFKYSADSHGDRIHATQMVYNVQ